MKKVFSSFALILICSSGFTQKIESIYFNLYTDSLKKEVYNYINVDGKLNNGKFIPLDSTHLKFSSSYGQWHGNNLIIDAACTKDSVVVTAILKKDTSIAKSITIYIKKRLTDLPLKSEKEVLEKMKQPTRKSKN